MRKERKGADLALHLLQSVPALGDDRANAWSRLFTFKAAQTQPQRKQALRRGVVQLASDPAPLMFLRSKELSADAPPLAFEGNELRHIVNTDEDMAPLMNLKRRNDDVEVVTFKGAASTIDAVETSPRAARDFAESLEDRGSTLVAVFD